MVFNTPGHADLTALDPFRSPNPLPILIPSNFVPTMGFQLERREHPSTVNPLSGKSYLELVSGGALGL